MLKICLQVIDGKNTVLGNTIEVGALQCLKEVCCMAKINSVIGKIINRVIGFYKGANYLYIRLLDNNPYSLINLSKQYNVSTDVFIGNKWGDSTIYAGFILSTNGEYRCWKPLGFERSVVYG